MEMPMMPSFSLQNLIRITVAAQARSPPERLMTAAVAPLVMNTNPLFTSVIINAWGAPTEDAANIMIIFGNPGFAPGGINGIAGSRFSIKLRARA